MAYIGSTKLDPPLDFQRDHVLGEPGAEMSLVEYGSYTSLSCHAAHEVIANLRDRFGGRMSYAYRHKPSHDSEDLGQRAAELAEYISETTGEFWPVHDALMKRGPVFTPRDFDQIASEFQAQSTSPENAAPFHQAKRRVEEDSRSAQHNGVLITPTFFINGRRYDGPWDENALAEAMLGTLGHRLHAATLKFVRWGPSAGLLLLLMSVLAVALANSPIGSAFLAFWKAPFGIQLNTASFILPLLDWVNHGLLSIFFLVVGLEIKREFTIGHLSTLRAGALPVIGAFGGIVVPVVIYLLIAPAGPLSAGWGVPIATDTAFAVALIVLLGSRVPVELRVFLTAAVIIDDLVAIGVIAFFYTEALNYSYLIASVVVTCMLFALNRLGIYRPLPYVVLGIVLWVCLHDAGLHATLAGVILALVTPALPPANLSALLAQADAILKAETRLAEEGVLRHGPSEPAMRALDAIYARTESPTDKLLRSMEPWSSYVVLPIFALANAGVIVSAAVLETHTSLMLAIILGLVIGKPAGIFFASWLAVRLGIAEKPAEYNWRQLLGAGALGGIGFTMSLFIAGEAFPVPADFAAAQIAIFLASILAGVVGVSILLKHPPSVQEPNDLDKSTALLNSGEGKISANYKPLTTQENA